MTFWGHFHRWQTLSQSLPTDHCFLPRCSLSNRSSACGAGYTVPTLLASSPGAVSPGSPPPRPGADRHPLLLCGSSCHTGHHGQSSQELHRTERDGSSRHVLTSSFPSRFPGQVYVSYDYGKSFQKISEKLNFGAGNSSKAVIAQFYHSPADNRRVRALLLESWAVPGARAARRAGHGPFVVFAA